MPSHSYFVNGQKKSIIIILYSSLTIILNQSIEQLIKIND